MNSPPEEIQSLVLHPSRWGRIPTEMETTLVKALNTNEQKALLIPEIFEGFKKTCEEIAMVTSLGDHL